jgi:hypothetical protein
MEDERTLTTAEAVINPNPPLADPAVEATPSSGEDGVVAADASGEAAAIEPAADPMSKTVATDTEEGASAGDDNAPNPKYPPIDHEFWDEVKAWTRRELHLAQVGGDEEHRKSVNP